MLIYQAIKATSSYVDIRSAHNKGSEVFREVTMKNVVFWDIKIQFLPHRRHITSSLHTHPVNAM
jgi:hypothetical protein